MQGHSTIHYAHTHTHTKAIVHASFFKCVCEREGAPLRKCHPASKHSCAAAMTHNRVWGWMAQRESVVTGLTPCEHMPERRKTEKK